MGPARPSWSTRRRADRPTWGPTLGRISARLGKPYMPWQQHLADLAGEVDPATGHLWYREVVVTVPRQSGKTTYLLAKWVWRAEAAHLLGGRQRMLYAAQTKNDAVDKFDEDFVEDLAAARVMRGRYRVTNHQGRKKIRFQSGSTLAPVATATSSGHGRTLDDGTLDEAFAQRDDRVEQAWRPAMITRPSAQLYVVSTAGTAESTYLRGKVERGRALVESDDPESRLAYVEYSADPALDPEDPATWATCMPALGLTQTVANVRHELQTMEGGLPAFMRSMLNVWPDGVLVQVLPAESWEHCRDPGSVRAGQPVLAVDVSPDRSSSAVAFAATRADGLPMVQIVRHGPGTEWVAEHVGELWRDKRPSAVVLDRIGPAHSLAHDLEHSGVAVEAMTSGDMADGCGSLFDAVVTEQLRHLGQAELDAAVAGAVKRPLGDRWAWARRASENDITPLVAATAALWGLSRQGVPSVW